MPERVPLSVLDLSIFGSGSSARSGLLASLQLARTVEALGYRRYWASEHHLNPGVAGSSPHVLLASVAATTEHIRIGTAATILGNYRPLQVVEAAGTVAALHPGRFDLGIGRSGTPGPPSQAGAPVAPRESGRVANRIVDGIIVPPKFVHRPDRAKAALQAKLLERVPGDDGRFDNDLQTVLDLIAGRYVSDGGDEVKATPGESEEIEVWVHGSSAGPSARIAGRRGLPFGASYQFAPATVLDAVEEYRAHFRPSERLAAPYVIVSADVLVAPDAAEAAELALGFDAWVLSLREGRGGILYPSPEEARLSPLSASKTAIVQDRLDTRFVGDPATVVAQLEALQAATNADELLIATHTHDPAHARRSFRLLAEQWHEGAGTPFGG